MHQVRLLSAFALLGLTAGAVQAQVDARMLRHPDVSETHITFVYAGDIWVAAKSGGTAQRLSSPPGEESFPRFSPDGSTIAFSGNYDGNQDIYTIPLMGGDPTRLTYHPFSDRVLDWYPDGDGILFASSRESGRQRFRQLFKAPTDGGLPDKLPLPYGEFGAISADGKWLAYTSNSREFRTWKRYRGGSNPDIWLFNLEDYSFRNITPTDANDVQPMWHERTVYFLSDGGPNQRYNVWAYDLDGEQTRQVTRFDELDVHFPAIGPSEIVFEAGGQIYLLDLQTERYSQVNVDVVTDLATLRPHTENVANNVARGDISPSGKRAVLEARGEIFSLPAEHGVIRNLTATPGIAERYPAWSPDGKYVAYWSDRSGEYELTIRPADGSGEEERLTSLGKGFRYQPFWSPDSKNLAFIDQAKRIQIYNRDDGAIIEIDQDLWRTHGGLSGFEPSWSADSRWLAYSRGVDNPQSAIFLFDTENRQLHQVTSGYYSSFRPVFDPDGKYLYFYSNRTFSPSYSDIDNTWVYPNTTNIVAVSLRSDVTSPLAPRNDEEGVKDEDEDGDEDEDEEKDEGEKKENGEKKEDGEGKKAVEIEIEGFESRLVVLPPEAGNVGNMKAVSGKLIYHRRPNTGSADEQSPIKYWDLKEREEKTIIGDADDFALSADGKKLLVAKDRSRAIIDVKPDQKMEKQLRTNELEMTVDPRAEWKQIFTDAWRFQRDYFYDPYMHGLNWNAVREHYADLMEDAVTRWDVNYVIGEMIAELNASHSYRGGGDTERAERRGVGMLGIDWSLENGAYRIEKIIDGAPWDAEARSPFSQPGVDVSEGDYILAVNGVPLDPSKDPWASFQGLAGETVALSVNSKPSMDGAREVLVETMNSESRLRHLAWIEHNRKMVEEATDGRVGYVYVRSTGRDGQRELVRQFAAQFDKDGMIIDERFNSGGQIPDRFIELLNRPTFSHWAVRDGKDWTWPTVAHNGPKVMLINGWSGSGGDLFPLWFKQAGLGKLIGRRTWGGLIGISGSPQLVDGGFHSVPTFRLYYTDGTWFEEGYGVDPDIEVLDNPTLMARGQDPQLEAAIDEVLQQLRENPPVATERPPYENRTPEAATSTNGQ